MEGNDLLLDPAHRSFCSDDGWLTRSTITDRYSCSEALPSDVIERFCAE